MDDSTLWIAAWLISALVCTWLYRRKGRNGAEGFVVGLVFGVFAVGYAAFFLKPRVESGGESTTL